MQRIFSSSKSALSFFPARSCAAMSAVVPQFSCFSSASSDGEERMRGRVKWFNSTRGYGFIETAEGDIFVHFTNILGGGYRSLVEGQEVEYSVASSPRGPIAVDVDRLLDEEDDGHDSGYEAVH